MPDRYLGDELRAWRIATGRTQKEAADLAKIKRSYYANLESNLQGVPAYILDNLAVAGFMAPNTVIGHDEPGTKRELVRVSVGGLPLGEVPIVGAAGAGPQESNVDIDTRNVWVPMNLANLNGIAFEVEGESMMPCLEPGDIAIFREYRHPKRGYTYLVRKAYQYRVKNLEMVSGRFVLRSLNPSFEDEPLDGYELIGYLVGLYRVIGTRETMDSDPGGLILSA